MRILIINAVYKIKSTGRTYYELSEYARKRGHECLTIYGNSLGKYQHTYFMGNNLDHKVHALRARVTGKTGHFSNFATKKLLRFIKKYNPDIVHLGNLHGNFVNIPMLLNFLGKNKIPTSITLHDCFFFTGYCTHYTVNNCFKWKESCFDCQYIEKNRSWFFDKSNFLFNAKKDAFNKIKNLGVIGVSDWITEQAKQSQILGNAKLIKRIYDWVDLETFKFTSSDIREKLNIKDKIVLGCIATKWDDNKGLSRIINLSRVLSDKYIILLIGQVDAVIQLPKNMIHVDFVDGVNELAKYYSVFDMFIQFSLQETFGKVVAESLSCGTPAIVFDSTASPELVNEECGQVLDKNADQQTIINAIEKIVSNGKQFYGEKCRKRAEELFEKDKNVQEYLDVFKFLVENKSL